MRTLFVSNLVPWPLDTGAKIRIHNILRSVAEVSEVTLVCFTQPGDEDEDNLCHVRGLADQCHSIPRDSCRYHKIAQLPPIHRRIRGFLDMSHPLRPSLLSGWQSERALRLIRDLRRRPFDLIWGEHLGSTNLLREFPRTRRVVDLFDVEHTKLGHKLRNTPSQMTAPLEYFESFKLRRFEKRISQRGYQVLVCSEVDRKSLGGGNAVRVVPNGIDLPASEMISREDATFLFPGTLDYPPNVDAAQILCREILPRIRQQIPHARVRIVGRKPHHTVSRLHDGQTVIVHADVPDIAPYFRRASAVVVPIRFGGGTRIKILEAMSYRTPVISSTVGAEGIEALSGTHLLLADNPDAFAGACVKMCRDRELRQNLADSGYALVTHRYLWSTIANAIKEVVVPATPEAYHA